MRLIEGDEFAQSLDQNGERAGVTFALCRFLADTFEALFNVVHLPFGGTPEPGNQLSAGGGGILATSSRRLPPRNWGQPSRRIARPAIEPVIEYALADLVLGENLRHRNAVNILLAHSRDLLGRKFHDADLLFAAAVREWRL
jgi:hypothetical protein